MLASRMFFDDMMDDIHMDNKMKCDVYEKDNKVFIEMDAPGYDKSDIKVECKNDNITIRAEKEQCEEENNDKKYLHRERRCYGKVERSFHLSDIDEDSIEAEFKDGILTITVDKIDEDKNKKFIEIK